MANQHSVRFDVSPVEPAASPLPETGYRKAVTRYLDSDVEALSPGDGLLVQRVDYHPLVAAAHLAFMR